MARKKVQTARPKTRRVSIGLSKKEYAALVWGARQWDMTLSELIRWALRGHLSGDHSEEYKKIERQVMRGAL